MQDVLRVLEMILPVLLMMFIGMFCARKKILSREGIAAIKKVAVNVSLPAVMFLAFLRAEYSTKTLLIPLLVFLLCLLGMALGYLALHFFPGQNRYLPFLTTGFEAGMLGYTLYAILYGENVSAFAAVDLGQVLFVFTIYKLLLSRRSSNVVTGEKTKVLSEIFQSPIIIAIFSGILMGASGLFAMPGNQGVASVITTAASFVAAPTSALILLSIGYDLISGPIQWDKAVKAVLIRLMIMFWLGASLILLVRTLFAADAALERAIVLLFVLPPPFVVPVFADDPEERSNLASSLSISTLFTLLAFVMIASSGF